MALDQLTELLPSGVVLVSAVWAIATIKSTTEKLGIGIDQLKGAVLELKVAVSDLRHESDNLRERIIRLELASARERDT